MSDYSLLMAVLGRDYEHDYIEFFKKHNVNAIFTELAQGTASKTILDFLGIENNGKIIIQTIVTKENASMLLSKLVTRMGINIPGTGIALTIPVASIGGSSSVKYLTEGQEKASTGDVKMIEHNYSLITVIAEKGYSDMVMDAARAAGATGGTVVRGKGTGTEFTAKYFGVSIAAEKEFIYIVAKKSEKSAIMKSIIENAGSKTPAHAVVFSLPVDEVVGLAALANDD